MKNKLIASLCLLSFSCYLTGCSNNTKEVETVTTETSSTENKNTETTKIDKPQIETTESESIKEIEDKNIPLTSEMPKAEKEENLVPIVSSEEEISSTEIIEETSTEETIEEEIIGEQLIEEKEPESETQEETFQFTVEKKEATLYAKSSVNVRTLPSTDGEIISTLSLNDEVKQTGICDNGWTEILFNNQTAYVSGKYLVDEKIVINYTWDDSIKNVDNATDYTLSQVSKYFLMVPEEIRTKFKENGWTINVTSGHLGQIIYNENRSIKAVIVYPKKEIWVDSRTDSAKAIIHEMGHFMDDQLFFTSMGSRYNDVWEAEVEIFRANHKTHINNTNTPTEYFAEFFEAMILNPSIKDKCPQTTQFINECIAEISTF